MSLETWAALVVLTILGGVFAVIAGFIGWWLFGEVRNALR